MGSETGAKWLIMLLLYFTIMTVIVTLVSDISPTPITTSGGYDLSTNTSGTYCGLPRTTYETWITDAGEKTVVSTSSDVIDGERVRSNADWIANIECKYSSGQLGEDQCLALDGCTWEEDTFFWFFGTGDYSCEGQFNHTWINSSEVESYWGFGDYIQYDDGLENDIFEDRPDYGICGYAPVVNNATRCAQMSCSWGENLNDIDFFDAGDIDVDLGMGKKIWNVIKDMVTFKFDFGFTNSTANFILNFLIFWLPLIGLGLAIYVMVRS